MPLPRCAWMPLIRASSLYACATKSSNAASGSPNFDAVPPVTTLAWCPSPRPRSMRSEEYTSELQSLMRISYAVFCLKKKKRKNKQNELETTTKQHKDNQHTQ